jgi:hypothetical protein
MKKPDWLTASLVVGALCGSLAGAVFTWWVNRDVPTVIGYTVSTTSTETVAAGPLVPKLSLRIDDRAIPAIHTHAIEIRAVSGAIEGISLAIDFGKKVEIFGNAPRAPSLIHYVKNFTVLDNGVRCDLQPIDGQGSYRIVLATDVATPPRLAITGKNVELRDLADIATTTSNSDLLRALILMGIAGLLSNIIIAVVVSRYTRVRYYRDIRKHVLYDPASGDDPAAGDKS